MRLACCRVPDRETRRRRPSPTLSPTDPVPRRLLTLCPWASSGAQGLYTAYIQPIYSLYTAYIQPIYRLYTGRRGQPIYSLYAAYIQAIYMQAHARIWGGRTHGSGQHTTAAPSTVSQGTKAVCARFVARAACSSSSSDRAPCAHSTSCRTCFCTWFTPPANDTIHTNTRARGRAHTHNG
jgi:hypothetical protein